MAHTLNRTQQIIVASVIGVMALSLVAGLGYVVGNTRSEVEVRSTSRTSNSMMRTTTDSAAAVATSSADVDRMLFLIEEEKLAHDVYTKLYEKYSVRVFSNIARSETMHQTRMLELLDARGIDDPRSSTVGVFKNADLQKLYDTLIAQGNQNITEAYKVGVAIEEKDIADIEADLKSIDAAQTDAVDTLNMLLRGSRNHLRAFNSQLG